MISGGIIYFHKYSLQGYRRKLKKVNIQKIKNASSHLLKWENALNAGEGPGLFYYFYPFATYTGTDCIVVHSIAVHTR